LNESNKTAQQQDLANTQQLRALEAARRAILITSSQQHAILDESRQALEDQLIASRKQTQIVKKMLDTGQQQQNLLAQQLETMRAQTTVLEEQWNRANQTPLLAVFTVSRRESDYVYLNLSPLSIVQIIGGPPSSVPQGMPYGIPFMIRNIGSASLRKPKVTASVESPAHYECVYFRAYNVRQGNPCALPPVELPDLLPDPGGNDIQHFKSRELDENFFVYFTIPMDSDVTTVHFTVSGENLTAATYSAYVAFTK
jgi:hypothetical protein